MVGTAQMAYSFAKASAVAKAMADSVAAQVTTVTRWNLRGTEINPAVEWGLDLCLSVFICG